MKVMVPVLAAIILSVAFSSCRKCEYCVPYTTNGQIDQLHNAQRIYSCSQMDIDAYENGKNYTDRQGDSITFKCN